jgi:hypothetical protein
MTETRKSRVTIFHQNSRKQWCLCIRQVGMQVAAPLVVGILAVLFSLPARAEGSWEMVVEFHAPTTSDNDGDVRPGDELEYTIPGPNRR